MFPSNEVTIGVSLPKTGRYAQSAGIFYERAYNLWLDGINKRGGLLGKRGRFLVYDDGSTPEKAAENYRRLIHDDKVPLLLGPCHSVLVEAAGRLCCILPNRSLKSQSEEQARSHLLHLAGAQRCDQRADFSLRNGLEMVKVDSAVCGHAVCLCQ